MGIIAPGDTTPPGQYAVLGDLGDGRLIVRMWVGDQTFDEEISIAAEPVSADAVIVARMQQLRTSPDASLAVEAALPDVIAQAVDLP